MLAETSDLSGSARPLPVVPISTPGGAAAAMPAQASAAADPLRATVATVVRVVEAQASRALQTVSAVNLNFQVGAADLAVRVEWRDGEVHTQFHTDSEELRAALASQWQAASPGLADRAVHFAPPVFSGSDAGGHSPATADGGAGARQQAQPRFPGQDRPGRPAAPRPAAAATTVPAPTPPARRAGSRHLHAVA